MTHYFPELDTILYFAGVFSILLFVLYVVLLFIVTLRSDGVQAAFIRLFSFRVVIPLLIVIAINLLSEAVVFVLPQQTGVVISFASPGGVRPEPLRGGVHLIVPFVERVIKYPIYWQTYTMSSTFNEGDRPGDDSIRARTSDGQEVRLDCSLIFRVDQEQAVLVHIRWQNRYREDLVRPVTRGVVRRQVSQFTAKEVNSQVRLDLENTLQRLLTEELEDKGFVLDQFLLRDVAFTPEYALSVEEKQVALEHIEKAQNEANARRERARGIADALIIEAQGQAQALALIAAELEKNPDLLTYRYIDKISPNIRVMLLPNNAPLILPLPQFNDGLTSTLTTSPTTSLAPIAPPAAAPTAP